MALWPNGSSNRPPITSGFGPRNASGGASSYHRGTDFIGFRVIKAVEDGVVRCSGSAPSGWAAGGDQVWIQHDGYFSKSLHQAQSLVSDGTWVRAGDDIGIMGESGSAQGIHQHFEITPGELHFANSGQVDPVAFLSSRIGGGGGGSNVEFNQDVQNRQNWLISRGYDLGSAGADGIAGPMYDAAVKKYQTFLRSYGYSGDIDGSWGNGTQEAHQKYWDQVHNPTPANEELKRQQDWLISRGYDLGPSGADGIWGAKSESAFKAYQEFLRAYGYSGAIDGEWGSGTQEAHQRYYDELRTVPSGTPAFPLAAHQWFGPESGGDDSISGYYSHSEDLKRWQQRMADRGWPITVDGLYGVKGATTPAGNTAEVAVAFQKQVGLDADGLIGPDTWKAAWEQVITPAPPTPANPNPTEPTPTPTPEPGKDLKYTPDLITPDASHFPSWIKFDVALDPDGQQVDNNKGAYEYYGELYNPVESHIHWWGEPGKAGTHDGNVSYIRNTKDLSVNFVLSAGRITLMVPINQIALTTGKRNPFAWKVENDPMITTLANDELGYKTLGYLHYIVGKLNPSLAEAPIRLHKEFMSTTCSGLDKSKVRSYAEKFRTGVLDPATGFPPTVTPEPEPTPDKVLIDRSLLKGLAGEFRSLATDFDRFAE